MLKCQNCGGDFKPTRSWNIFCNSNCRKMAWFKRHKVYWSNYVKEYNKRHKQNQTEYHNQWSKAKGDALRDSGYSELSKQDKIDYPY